MFVGLFQLAVRALEMNGIPINMPTNSFLVSLQNMFNRTSGIHQIFLFSKELDKTAAFKGERKETHKNSLSVYFDGSEYYGVRDTSHLFGNPKQPYGHMFCPDTSAMVHNNAEHRESCTLFCPACCRHGYEVPCKETCRILCDKCNRTFMNEECYEAHIELERGFFGTNVCQSKKRCPKCGYVYRMKKKNFIHKCGEKFCSSCVHHHKKSEPCPI